MLKVAKNQMKIKIVGGGLAGVESAWYLANRGHQIDLYDMKPYHKTPAHHADTLGELVCSNSLKSDDLSTASGLLKAEMRMFGSIVLEVADETKVPAGGALSVSRQEFSDKIDSRIRNHPNINVVSQEIVDLDYTGYDYLIIATGPLTSSRLAEALTEYTGDALHFFDAAAPIVSAETIDMTRAFRQSRYDKGGADYINCPMEKDEYLAFYDELVKAEVSNLHEFEKREIFESCMPIEIMAKRGADTLRYGPLKPVGLTDPHTGRRPYAVVQLRQDDMSATMYNLVGFQTNLRRGEQKRVFSMIPGLQNAEFVKYGVMHRNTYVNAPTCLNSDFSLKRDDHIYIAGQLSGVEGYVESAMSGLVSAISIHLRNEGKQLNLPNTSIIGALTRYISYENEDFQPMNANFGILPELEEHIRDKSARKLAYSARAIRDMLEVVSYMED